MTETTTEIQRLATRLADAGATVEDVKYHGQTIRYSVPNAERPDYPEYVEVGVAADGTAEWYVHVRASGYARRCVSEIRYHGLNVAADRTPGADRAAERPRANLAMLTILADAGVPIPVVQVAMA